MKTNNKYHLIVDVVQLLAGIVVLLAGTISIINICKKSETDLVFVAIAIVLFMFMLLLLVAKYWNMAITRYENYNSKIHSLNHRLRNEIFILKKLYDEKKLTELELVDNLRSSGQFAVDLLSDLLTEITGNEISVHIKTFPVTTSTKNAYRTLCISHRSDSDRLTIHDHPIDGNTHLKMIVNQRNEAHFYSNDFGKTMKDYKKITGKDFLISTISWEKWYNSIIIVPIRIDSRTKRTNAGEFDYEYVGFICCDAKEKNAFRKKEINGHLDLIKSFADILYIYFDEVRDYSTKIN